MPSVYIYIFLNYLFGEKSLPVLIGHDSGALLPDLYIKQLDEY